MLLQKGVLPAVFLCAMNILEKYVSAEITVKNSRFLSELFPCDEQGKARAIIREQKAKYTDAKHVVHAFIIGLGAEIMGMSDDGEPSGTAGRPVLDVVKGRKLHKPCTYSNALVRGNSVRNRWTCKSIRRFRKTRPRHGSRAARRHRIYRKTPVQPVRRLLRLSDCKAHFFPVHHKRTSGRVRH